MTALAGSTLDLLSTLTLNASSTFSDVAGNASRAAFVYAANTAAFSIDVLTPGGGYTTETGLRYDSAAPEPSVFALTGSAAILLFARRFRPKGDS